MSRRKTPGRQSHPASFPNGSARIAHQLFMETHDAER